MKKVLIVDDEYLVRLGLRATIDWTQHGFVIVGEAANGEEALRLFDQTQPDILLTDIKMPVMDGIRLIELVKERKPSIYVVILSNHDDFSYARKALHLGASQYILKSELREEIILSALHLASDALDDSSPDPPRRSGRLEQSLRRCLPRLGREKPDLPPELSAQMRPGQHIAAACRCDTSQIPPETRNIFYKTCRTMLEGTDSAPLIVSAETGDILRTLVLVSAAREEDAARFIENMRRVVSNLLQYYDIILRVGFSGVHGRDALSDILLESGRALDMSFFGEENCLVWRAQPEGVIAPVRYRVIEGLIEERQWTPLKEELSRLFARLRAQRSMPATETCYIDLLSIVRQTASANALLGEEFLSEKKINYHSYASFDNIDAMEVYIVDLYRSMMNVLCGRGERFSSVVTRTISFIQENFSRPVSLSEAANISYVSKSYLSLLFKQETGINFSKYIMDCRIERAKQLLRESSLRIYEIAEQVGFPNPYYFSKVFREYTGVSCKEYRDHATG